MEIPRYWRLKAQRYRLEGSVCPACGQLNFPPRPVSPHCTSRPARIAAHDFVPVVPEQIATRQVGLNNMPNESPGVLVTK